MGRGAAADCLLKAAQVWVRPLILPMHLRSDPGSFLPPAARRRPPATDTAALARRVRTRCCSRCGSSRGRLGPQIQREALDGGGAVSASHGACKLHHHARRGRERGEEALVGGRQC
jgi:hypothetical protein